MQHILLTEDDETIALGLRFTLEEEGYGVTVCRNAAAAFKALEENRFDIAILDISLPDGNGHDICRAVKSCSDTPVIFLTVLGEEADVVKGLDMGADDYITKPFRLRELISRVHTVLRRAGGGRDIIVTGALSIDIAGGKVAKNGEEIALTALEFRLLQILAVNRDKLLTRSRLLEEIWDIGGDFVNDNTLTVYIKRLREKIEDDPQKPVIIQTVRGLGYKLGT